MIDAEPAFGERRRAGGLGAAAGLGLPAGEVQALRRAGLVHHFGRLGVSSAIWDRRGALGVRQMGWQERVRMVPYLTERMLQQIADARPALGALAAQHCERMDGSGYPRGLRGCRDSLIAARVLAAASAYQAMCEPRPHRPAHAPGGGGASRAARRGPAPVALDG